MERHNFNKAAAANAISRAAADDAGTPQPTMAGASGAAGGGEGEAHSALVSSVRCLIQERGCRTLMDLAVNNAQQRSAMVGSGVARMAVACMAVWRHSLAVQEYGCGLLGNLAVDVEHTDAVVETGGAELVW